MKAIVTLLMLGVQSFGSFAAREGFTVQRFLTLATAATLLGVCLGVPPMLVEAAARRVVPRSVMV